MTRVKKCMFVALLGSENRDRNWGAAGDICDVRVELGLSPAFIQRLADSAWTLRKKTLTSRDSHS